VRNNHTNHTAGLFERFLSLSYVSLFSLWLLQAVSFGMTYFLLAIYFPTQSPQPLGQEPTLIYTFLNSLYYSVVTATSTGFGDILPHGFSKVLSCLQSVLAVIIFVIFITKLVSHKQDIAIQEMHKFTYEDVFHNIREGLFIVRKDFDRLLRKVEDSESLTADDWTDLAIACEQIQMMVQEIPAFYASDTKKHPTGIYTIDAKREQLLHEAVERTLRRLNQLLDAFASRSIDWNAHEASSRQLKELVIMVAFVAPQWAEQSPYRDEPFVDIVHLNESIRGRLELTMKV
jgi:SHS2 domain-containing protein